MKRVSLPSGAWADLREVADVTERQRRPIRRIQAQLAARPAFAEAIQTAQAESKSDAPLSTDAQLSIAAGMGDAFDLLEELNDSLVTAMVAGWSYASPLTVDGVQDLPGADLDALREAVAPFMRQLMPNFEPDPAPASPIVPSVA